MFVATPVTPGAALPKILLGKFNALNRETPQHTCKEGISLLGSMWSFATGPDFRLQVDAVYSLSPQAMDAPPMRIRLFIAKYAASMMTSSS